MMMMKMMKKKKKQRMEKGFAKGIIWDNCTTQKKSYYQNWEGRWIAEIIQEERINLPF